MVETSKGTDRLTFRYDYMVRRVEKCVYSGNTLASKTYYVYDGFKCIEELDAMNGSAVAMRHAWQPFDVGLDVILATTDGNDASCFLHDANKNVMQKTGADGALQENYAYAPFGENTGAVSADIGFSSEAFDSSTYLSYYNYRYYSHELDRWIKRDPIDGMIDYILLRLRKPRPLAVVRGRGFLSLNKLTEKDRINLLANYILGAVEAATSSSPIIH